MLIGCLILIIGVFALTSCEELEGILGTSAGPDASEHVHTVVADKAVAPTCTEDGLTGGKHCSVCNEVIVKQDVLPAYGHKESTDNGYAPTCTTPGLTDGTTCSICSQVVVAQQIIPALGHTEVTDKAVDATCTEDGLTEGKHCSVCNTVIVSQKTVPAAHKVVVDPAVEPTCTEDGFTEGKHCSACDTVIVAQETLPAGHKFGEWDITVEPTEESEGSRTRTCTGCETVETETLAILEHDHERWAIVSEGKDATCTEAGYTAGKVCSKCGEAYAVSTVIPATGHSHTAVVTAPTCTEGGYTTHTCHCGDSYVDSHVDATGHNRVTAPAVDPTCTKTGLTAGEKCANCGEIYVAQETVDALGHVEETVPGREPTCDQPGLTDGKKCTRCNRDTVFRQVIPALGHDMVNVAMQAPTCTENGWSEYEKCTRCAYKPRYQDIPATGHDEDIIPNVAPTCDQPGSTGGKKCKKCNTITVAPTVVPALGGEHAYALAVAPGTSGIYTPVCTKCSSVKPMTVITYAEYGAKGDGRTDDSEAIRKAHNAANYFKLPVMGEAGATYYIGAITETITIKTNTDWNGAHFIFDDSQIRWDSSLRSVYVFTIAQDANNLYQSITVPTALKNNGLSKGATKIEGLNLTGPAMIRIENSNQRIFKRYGVNADQGDAMQEMLYVDKDGNIIGTPVQYDYSTITKIEVYSVSEESISVGNGSIVTIVPDPKAQDPNYENNYCFFNRGILVRRSNTIIYGITHTIEGEQFSVIVDRDGDGYTGTADPDGDGLPEQWTDDKSYGVPYNGFFAFEYVYNAQFKDCQVQGHQAYNFYQSGGRNEMGSYDIYAHHCVNLKFYNIQQRKNYGDADGNYKDQTVITNRFMYHGIMGSYYCRNFEVDNCYLDRFDSHKGLHSARLTNSTFGFGILVIGGGDLYIEKVYRPSENHFILLREDYNSIFDGDITIKDCRMGSKVTNIVTGSWRSYETGLPNYMVRSLTIDGLTVETSGSGYNYNIYLFNIGGAAKTSTSDALNPVILPTSVSYSNVTKEKVSGLGYSNVKVNTSRNSGDAFSTVSVTKK